MTHVQVLIERRSDIPADLPAVWATEPNGLVRLFLRHDLSDRQADHFERMCREVCVVA